ncbi:MAG: hypothetical protein AB7F72_17305, partial [Afipia sp.]
GMLLQDLDNLLFGKPALTHRLSPGWRTEILTQNRGRFRGAGQAKWQDPPVGAQDLRAFSLSVGSKAQWSRGLFISFSGFSRDGLFSFAQGIRTNIICMDGFDLHEILNGKLNLVDVFERKIRRAAETNASYVSVRELY